MLSRPFSYLFSISYFGARFKGWAKQKGLPTIEGKLERVFRYVLGHENFSFIGSSRTDSGVSCRKGYVQFFMHEPMDFSTLLSELNRNLGGEIRLHAVQTVPRNFNLIRSVSQKTYRYFFSDSDNFHPFASAFMTSVSGINTFEQMQINASQFIGKHDFSAFCKISGNKSDFVREVVEARVFENQEFSDDYFPVGSFCFEVKGTGFLYHQVRKMVNTIWHFSPDQIRERLEFPAAGWDSIPAAPANGLVLWDTELKGSFVMESSEKNPILKS